MENVVRNAFEGTPDLRIPMAKEEFHPVEGNEELQAVARNVFQQIFTAPQMVGVILEGMIKALNEAPAEEVNKALVILKKGEESHIGLMFKEILGALASTKGALSDAQVISNLKAAAVQKEISKLVDHPVYKKMAEGVRTTEISKKYAEFADSIENAEGKKFANEMLKKFHLAPKTTFKEKLAKVWRAIGNFFKKLFCCCKKKEKLDANGNVNASPVAKTKEQKSPKSGEVELLSPSLL